MKRFVEGMDRGQSTLFPECLEDWICEDNPVRVIDVFVGGLDLAGLRFCGVDPEATGRPSYHPSVLLKLYIYGYLNRVQSSRRLEREACRNVEVMWLAGRLEPTSKSRRFIVLSSLNPFPGDLHHDASCLGIKASANANPALSDIHRMPVLLKLRSPLATQSGSSIYRCYAQKRTLTIGCANRAFRAYSDLRLLA